MPYHRLTFRTDTPTCVTCGSEVRIAVPFVTESCPGDGARAHHTSALRERGTALATPRRG